MIHSMYRHTRECQSRGVYTGFGYMCLGTVKGCLTAEKSAPERNLLNKTLLCGETRRCRMPAGQNSASG